MSVVNKLNSTNPNQQVDLMSQSEHQCCAAARVMVIAGGAEVYLDERLELGGVTVQLYFSSVNNCMQQDCDLTSFSVPTSSFSMAEITSGGFSLLY